MNIKVGLAAVLFLVLPVKVQHFDCKQMTEKEVAPYTLMMNESIRLMTPGLTRTNDRGQVFEDWIDAPQAREAEELRIEAEKGIKEVMSRYNKGCGV